MLVIARRIRLALPAAACTVALVATAAAPAAQLKQGDTPADYPGMARPAAAVTVQPKQGDTPADYPGASRSPHYVAPQTIAVVRPERTTVVRETQQSLSLVLAGAAFLLALGGLAVAIARPARLVRH
jgi:hypothetical protein